MSGQSAIEDLRSQINDIDDQLLVLMRKRFNICKRIITDEHRLGMPMEVFSHEQEQSTLDRLKRSNEESDCPMRASHIGNIWQTIFSCVRTGW